MKTTIAAVASLALLFATLLCLPGCHSDPHDTHISAPLSPPR